MCFNTYIIDLQVNKACDKVARASISFSNGILKQPLHFVQVAALGHVKNYSRIEALPSVFRRA